MGGVVGGVGTRRSRLVLRLDVGHLQFRRRRTGPMNQNRNRARVPHRPNAVEDAPRKRPAENKHASMDTSDRIVVETFRESVCFHISQI